MLKAQQVLNPTNQYYRQTGVACTRLDTTRPYNWCGATVADIRSNPVYLGHTLNMQSSTLSAEDAENTEVHFIPSLEIVVQQMTAQTQVS